MSINQDLLKPMVMDFRLGGMIKAWETEGWNAERGDPGAVLL